MKEPNPLVSGIVIGAQAFGLFALPFAVGGAAALCLDVSEVADTANVLVALGALLLMPPFLLQMAGIALKVNRERAFLRSEGRLSVASTLSSVRRHISIVTPRGWAALFTGLWFVGLSLAFKWASLGLVAVISLFLFYAVLGASSFVSTFLVRSFAAGLGRGGAGIRRELSPAVVTAGDPAEERFHLSQVPVPTGFLLLISDPNPPELATESRYAIGPGARRSTVTVAGRFRRTPRGLHRLGPAQIWYQDALGFTRVPIASLASAELKVLPRFVPLEVIAPPRSRLEAPDLLTRPHRFATEDFFRFKEYAAGDDTRRIQWRLSMRTGRLQVRQPESKEISTRRVLLALDTWLPPAEALPDAVGVSAVLDRLVETWISVAWSLVEAGDRVVLIAAVDDGRGRIAVEQVRGDAASRRRWQDLGARARWQGSHDLPAVLDTLGPDMHAVVVSSRFEAPAPAGGASTTWVYLPPQEALGAAEPPVWQQIVGPGPGAGGRLLARLFRLPGPAGSDENAMRGQLGEILRVRRARSARVRLRSLAARHGKRTLDAILQRGDALYRLEPGPVGHRLVGVQGPRL